jgi:CRISPR-associated endonuclease/helicase Cas3
MDYIAHKREIDGEEQSVKAHSDEVAEYCKKWCGKIGLPTLGELIGKLHDLGKTTEEFREYILYCFENPEDKSKRGTVDHSTAGALYLYHKYSTGDSYDRLLVEIVALIICSHHGGLMNFLDLDCSSDFLERMSKDKEKIHYDEAATSFFQNCCSEEEINHLFQSAKKEFLVLRESLKKRNKTLSNMDLTFLTKYLFSCLIDADRLDTALFMDDKNEAPEWDVKAWDRLLLKMEEHLESLPVENEIDNQRKKISEACRKFAKQESDIYSLTVPTGGGKTFSSFRYALAHVSEFEKERIIYFVPFTTIIDQNASDIKEIFEGEDFILEHHSNIIRDNDDEDYKLLTERWDSPVIFTTTVQFLNTILKGGTQDVRRMHHLANAVLIFDEAQAIPLKCISLFNVALNFLSKVCNSTIILCTATQPALDTAEKPLLKNANSEIISDLPSIFKSFKRVNMVPQLIPGGHSCEQLTNIVFEKMEAVNSVLVVLNTKKSVTNLYRKIVERNDIREKVEQYKIFHLSTNMCPAHRMDVLTRIRKSLTDLEKVICISTQLIEAGINISFNNTIRALAGLDSIAQAAGRCNRHGKDDKPGDVYIVDLEDENLSMLPDIKIGQEVTRRILAEFKKDQEQFNFDLLSPEAIQRYFRYYYAENKDKMDFPLSLNRTIATSIYELLDNNKKGQGFYKNKTGKPVDLIQKKAYKLAGEEFYVIPENTTSVLVPYKMGEELIADINGNCTDDELRLLLRQAQRYSVNLYEEDIRVLNDNEGLYLLKNGGILAVKEEFYDEETGVILSGKKMKFLGV